MPRKYSRLLVNIPSIKSVVCRFSDAKPQSTGALELTLAILKPDVCKHPVFSTHIMEKLAEDFYLIQSRHLQWKFGDAERFYAEHKDRFFFDRVVSFMSSGPILACVLAGENAILRWRKEMGPTKVYRTVYEEPDTIRGMFGLSDTRNSVHGSDSVTTAAREINFFFPKFKLEEWYQTQEESFRKGNVIFNKRKLVHQIRRCL